MFFCSKKSRALSREVERLTTQAAELEDQIERYKRLPDAVPSIVELGVEQLERVRYLLARIVLERFLR